MNVFDFNIADPAILTYVLLLNTADIASRYTEVRLSQLGMTPTQYTVLVTLRSCDKPPTLTGPRPVKWCHRRHP